MTHLTHETLDAWAAETRRQLRRPGPPEGYVRRLLLAEGDSVSRGTLPSFSPPYDKTGLVIHGPALVELVVFRDGGWSAREVPYLTPDDVVLIASLTQQGRQDPEKAARFREAWGERE